MKLCELCDTEIQGNIEIRLINEDDDVIDSVYFNGVERLSSRMEKLAEWEDHEVVHIFSDLFVRKYPNSEVSIPYLVIEIKPD